MLLSSAKRAALAACVLALSFGCPSTKTPTGTPGFTVSAASGPTTEAGGTATFTVVLQDRPSSDVTLHFDSDNKSEGTVSKTSLTFTSNNWNAKQTVTVTGVDDAVADGDQTYHVVFTATTSGDSQYSGKKPNPVTLVNQDNDSAGIVVTQKSNFTTESGASATFDVVLKSAPTANVTLVYNSSNTGEGTVSPPSITFTNANWNAPQTVTVKGVDDAVADGNQDYQITFFAPTTTDAKYAAITPDALTFTNIDNDTPGFTVGAPSGPTTESGGTATFSIVLNSKPKASVTVNMVSDNTAEGSLSGVGSKTFTTANWNVPQRVTVTGVDDSVADGNQTYHVTFGATTSTDAAYAAIKPADVTLVNVDNDTPGILVSAISGPTTEAGGTATFTIVLASQPSADVSFNLTSSKPGEGIPAPSAISFTTGNWNTPQTITVTGVDDFIDDGNQPYQINFGAITSQDPLYAALTPAAVQVTNLNDDHAGITVSAVSGPTTEGGGQATFTVVLTSQPVGDVTVNFDSDNHAEGTASATSLTFTAGATGTWGTPQTVTLTGVDDAVADGNQTYHVVFSATQSTDTAYAAMTPATLSVINVDNDTAGFVQTPISGDTSEDGTSATFTLALSSEPSGDVTVNLSSDNVKEGTVSAASLTFTAGASGNWATPQTLTVTGVDDANADGAKTYHVVFGATTSTDATYAALKPANVTVVNHDNDPIAFYNFDTGSTVQGWTVFGLWNDDATPATVGAGGASSWHSAPNSLNYNNGTDYAGNNSGTATSPTINISPYGNPTLTFWCNYQVESDAPWSFDVRRVQVSNDGFATLLLNEQLLDVEPYGPPATCPASGTWHQHTLPLDPSWGTIQVRFSFDTGDANYNDYAGWFIDDVTVISP